MGKWKLLRKNSILLRVLALMLSTLLVMFIILYCAIFYGGMTEQLRQNAFDILSERVVNQKNTLERDMLQRWANISDSAQYIEDTIGRFLEENHAAYPELNAASELTEAALSSVSPRMIYLLRRNSVTGVFVVFNGNQPAAPPSGEEVQNRAGLYIRDYEPESDPDNYSDLTLERCPAGLSREIGITMDSYWSPTFSFSAGENNDFYFKPYLAALRWQEAEQEDLGYWSPLFSLQEDATGIITYSIPLLDEEGVPFGVMGIELTKDYLMRKMPYSEITGENQGSYLLAVGSREEAEKDSTRLEFDDVIASGPYYQRIFSASNPSVCLEEKLVSDTDTYSIDSGGRVKDTVYGCVKYLKLYNTNTPFENEQWALIGVVEDPYLLGLYNNIRTFLLLVLLGTFLLGAFSVFLVSVRFTRPIIRLAKRVQDSDPRRPVALGKVNVAEIDELSTAVEHLSQRVAESYSKLSEIMRVAGFRVGAFEYAKESRELIYTDQFLEVIDRADWQPDPETLLGIGEFERMMKSLEGCVEESAGGKRMIYHMNGEKGERWIRLEMVEDDQRFLGVASDVTTEYTERKKIEYERDYDLLTSLLNRRAFHTAVERMFETEFPVGAAVMMDLDNLKYINDTYGHDCGDQYICRTAAVLQQHVSGRVIAARMSGDEFYLFIRGNAREEVAAEIQSIEEDFQRAELALPDGETVKIRISGGIAWYPWDSRDYQQLLRYADFAMYRVKHTTKGQFVEFDLSSYQEESFLLHNKEELNRLIDDQLVEYVFQPIVSVENGNVFAYEALMRPVSTAFRNPMDVLAVARSQSKLYQIERLTWFKAMEAFQRQSPPDGTCRIFLNSIPNQILSANDLNTFEHQFQDYLSRIVVELTEEEKPDDTLTKKKWKSIRQWGAEVALDDYGAGYNGEAVLLTVEPGYLKIDRMIVSQCDKDAMRRQFINNIVSYAASRGIYVVAEGVETREELETVIRCGVHYLQGYYLAKPEKRIAEIPRSLSREIRAIREERDSPEA